MSSMQSQFLDRREVLEIQERGSRVLDRTILFDQRGQSLILPQTRALDVVEVKDVADGAKITARGLVGFLPLTESHTLNITPKFPFDNLWRMLEIAGHDYSRILPVMRKYSAGRDSPPTELLIRSYCHYLEELAAVGFGRAYQVREQVGFYRPSVAFGATMSRFLSRGNPLHVVANSFEFTINTPLNRLVKRASQHFLRLVPRESAWNRERRILMTTISSDLALASEAVASDMDFESFRAASSRLQHLYGGLLRVYKLFVTGGGLGFRVETGGIEMPSFLFNLDDVFERFVRETLQSALRADGVTVLDGNKHNRPLFVDNNTFPIKPDLIFQDRSRRVLAIGEAKYKPKLKEADRYQLIAHTIASQSAFGVLFSPSVEGQSTGIARLGALPDGTVMYHYFINLDGNLAETQDKMTADLRGLLAT